MNPFNKNEDGTVKSYHDIRKEIELSAIDWQMQPVRHAKCK